MAMVMLDSNGELLEQTTLTSITLRSPETAHETDRNKHYEEVKTVQQLVIKHNPNLVVVGTNSLHAMWFRRSLLRDIFKVITTEGYNEEMVRFEVEQGALLDALPYTIFGDMEVARIFSNSQRCRRMFPDYS
jgi:hypothetical protein